MLDSSALEVDAVLSGLLQGDAGDSSKIKKGPGSACGGLRVINAGAGGSTGDLSGELLLPDGSGDPLGRLLLLVVPDGDGSRGELLVGLLLFLGVDGSGRRGGLFDGLLVSDGDCSKGDLDGLVPSLVPAGGSGSRGGGLLDGLLVSDG